jgi:hypothetical protein
MNTLAKQRAEPKPEDGLTGSMPSFDRILSAIGLSGVQTLAANLTQDADGALAKISINVPESARKGLFTILAVNAKDASPPPFVPADAVSSIVSASIWNGWTTIRP